MQQNRRQIPHPYHPTTATIKDDDDTQARFRRRPSRGLRLRISLLPLLLLLPACVTQALTTIPPEAASASPSASPSSYPFFAPIKKVVLVVLENTGYQTALLEPFVKQLTQQGALLSQYFAITHPSQPNYLALMAGDDFGITHDRPVQLNARHLGDLLDEQHKTWKTYAEGYPGDCFLRPQAGGRYYRKHTPFLSFTNVTSSPSTRCAQAVVNAKHFERDVALGQLPDFSLYIPDIRNDGHDTGIHFALQWLEGFLPPVLKLPDTLLIITFDEDDRREKNHILTLLLGAGVKPQAVSTRPYDHYSLLKTLELIFHLPRSLSRNDAMALPILDVWGSTKEEKEALSPSNP